MLNKRGQVFLMAAVIITGLIFGASRTLNYVSVGSNQEAFYDLTDEIGYEVGRVIDYGVFNGLTPKEEVFGFIGNYTEYLITEEFVVVYGKFGDVFAVNYERLSDPSSLRILTGVSGISIPIETTQTTYANLVYDQTSQKVTVKIRDINYDFNLKQGENFYFVIIKDDDEEKFVST
jgi:hypothetical protein